MRRVNNVRLLKHKLAEVRVKLHLEEVRNERLTVALGYYAKRLNHLGLLGAGVGVANKALRD